MRKFKAGLFTLLLLSVVLQPVFAGAWVQEKGKSQHIFSHYFYTTDRVFERYGKLDHIGGRGRFTKNEFNYYTEAGIFRRLTAVGNFFYDIVRFKNDSGTDTNSGFGDQEMGLRWNLAQKPFVTSLQGLVIFPLYPGGKGTPLGNRDVGLEPKILFGKSFHLINIPSYINLEGGVRFRIGAPSDQLRYQILWGVKPWKKWEYTIAVEGIEGLRNEEPLRTSNNVTKRWVFSTRCGAQFRGDLKIISRCRK